MMQDSLRFFFMILKSYAILGAAVWLAALTGCSKSGPESGTVAAKAEPPSVAIAVVQREDLANDTVLSAEFRPHQEIDLHAKVAGYLKAIHVDVGDRVREGQLLAELEIPEMRQELEQATSLQKRSELDAARARTEVERAETLVRIRQLSYDRLAKVAQQRPNLIAQQEIDNLLAQLQDARVQVATAKATLATTEAQIRVASTSTDKASTMLAYTRITAPFAGVITKRFADAGALIQAGTSSASQAKPVVRLSKIDRLRLVLAVPESIVSRVKVGTPVSIRADNMETPILGRVSRFSNQLISATRTMETEVDVPNSDNRLLPGMYAYATIQLDQQRATLTIPIQAAAGAEREQTVFVVNANNQIEARKIRLGMDTSSKYEVVSGLEEGEKVVVGTRGRLKPGDTVRPQLLAAAGRK
jgi:RND family efflux transporter MFP subunit